MMPSKGLVPQSIFAGQFRVIQSLAQGGMGAIYQVEQLPTGHPRALKVILPEFAQDPRARARFEQEARIAAHIESEHVAQVIAAGVDGETNTPWLAMELLQGKDLAAVLTDRGRLPHAEVYETVKQLSHALAAAHRIGVIHRDLKPENVFVAASRRSDTAFTVKVLDFGVAKWMQESRPGQATAVVGSPLWMAPEQLDARGILGPHTDIWALGLLAFAMLAGKPYWRGASAAHFSLPEIVGEIMAAPMVPASQRAAELGAAGTIPNGFDAWFARCTERDGALRFRDVNESFAAFPRAAAAIPATGAMHAQPQPTPGISPTVAVPMMATPMPLGFGSASQSTPPPAGGTMAWTPGAAPFPTGPSPFPTGPSPFQSAQASQPGPFQAASMASGPQGFAAPSMQGQAPYQPSQPQGFPPPQGYPQGAPQVYGAAPGYGSTTAAPWQTAAPARPPSNAGVIAAVVAAVGLVLVVGGGAAAYVLLRPACASDEHASRGHCCTRGAEWSDDRRACVCQNLALCGGATIATAPPIPQPQYPQPQYPQPQYPQPQQPAMTPLPTPQPMPTMPPPRPTIIHACDGVWSGTLVENTGSRGSMNLMVRAASSACARWTERWGSGAVCNYVLTSCTVTAQGLRGVGRTSSRGCTGPVSASISCSPTGASFREQVGNVVDSAALSRR